MVNLLGNSIRYTEAGGLVHIHTAQNEKDGPYMSMTAHLVPLAHE